MQHHQLEYLLSTKEFAGHSGYTFISKKWGEARIGYSQAVKLRLDNEENEPGVPCIGARVFDENGPRLAPLVLRDLQVKL
jgi:DNA-binding IclR family transcriptional regulator